MTREEALQAIKAKMDYYESDKRLRAALETIIPELCESEDKKKSAIDLIAEERKNQISNGFNWKHDDEHDCHQLSDAAIVYTAPAPLRYQVMNWWPWDEKDLKEDDSFTTEGRIRELVKAGALIVAEIERLQRTINNVVKPLEREDERIRRGIIAHIQGHLDTQDDFIRRQAPGPFSSEEVKFFMDALAYLEKQKDASKAIEAVDRIDKYIDEHLANAHDMKDSNPDKKYYRGWDDALGKMAGILQDVYSGENQKEQKSDVEIYPNSVKSKSCSETGYPIEDCDYGLEIALNILEKTLGKVQGFQTDDGIREHQTAIKAVKDAMKKQKPIKMEVYEVGKGTTICGQDYKCKKDYKAGNCWYIKDVIYHCGRDGFLIDQNGISWSCTPEWFKEYIYSNAEWAEKEKNDFVGGPTFLRCKLSFDDFKEGEHYWLEYVGDDIYVGRSDNILNQKFHITPRQLYTLFSQQLEEKQKEQKSRKFKLGDEVHWHDDDTNVITITGFRDDAYLTDSAYGPILFCDEDNWEKIEQEFAGWDKLQEEFRNINEAFESGKKEVVDNPEKYGLCRPVEWSEEGEKTFWGFTAYIPDEELKRLGVTRLDILKKFKSLRPQPKKERQIKEGDKVNIHCRKNRKEDIITFYDGKVGEVIHVYNAKKHPWGHIIVRLDNGCNDGFYEDELEILDEPSWRPSEEQMEALRECGECKRCIKKLYEDLQKRYGTC